MNDLVTPSRIIISLFGNDEWVKLGYNTDRINFPDWRTLVLGLGSGETAGKDHSTPDEMTAPAGMKRGRERERESGDGDGNAVAGRKKWKR